MRSPASARLTASTEIGRLTPSGDTVIGRHHRIPERDDRQFGGQRGNCEERRQPWFTSSGNREL